MRHLRPAAFRSLFAEAKALCYIVKFIGSPNMIYQTCREFDALFTVVLIDYIVPTVIQQLDIFRQFSVSIAADG